MKRTQITITALSLLGLVPALVPVAAGSARPPKPAGMPQNLEAGYKAWASRCSQCHEPQRAYNRKYSDEKAVRALVSRMARKPGAAIGTGDQKKIVAYLAWYNNRDTKSEDNREAK